MSGGGSGGGSTTTTDTRPPEPFQTALSNTLGQAQAAAAQPYENYPGQLQAGFSPQQLQGFGLVGSTPGIAAPFINAGAQHIDAATQPLWDTLPQYSQQTVDKFYNPYVNDVVDATQAQFNNQNAIAANRMQGDAASRGALGGDRAGVAQAVLAGQQQLAQAPVIAGLQNQGFAQAQQEFNQQQQQQLGADQANAWLNMQAGQGFGQLGQQALGSTLTSANALLGTGAMQQAQAQQALNIPFSQWQAQKAYPFQDLSWLAGTTQGLASTAGGTGTSTTPGASPWSQAAGIGTGIAGLAGAANKAGLFSGWGGGDSGGGASSGTYVAPAGYMGDYVDFAQARGGAVPHRASGGGVEVPMSGFGVPDDELSLSIFPAMTSSGFGGGGHGATTTEGGGSAAGDTQKAISALGTVAQIAGIAASIFAKRGGRIPHRAPGGHIAVPQIETTTGDTSQPIFVSSAPSSATGFALPQMHVNSAPTAGLGSGASGSLDSYLSGVLSGAWKPPMGPQSFAGQLVPPKPSPASTTMSPEALAQTEANWNAMLGMGGGGGGTEGGGGSGAGAGDSQGGNDGTSGGPEQGSDGSMRRGGWIRHGQGFAQGGDTEDSDLLGYSTAFGGPPDEAVPTLGGDALEMPTLPDYQPAPAVTRPVASQAQDLPESPTPSRDTGEPAIGTSPTFLTDGFGRFGPTEDEKAEAKTKRHDDRAMNAWLALAEAGFGMAAGRSPYAAENIGRGALLGVQSYSSAEKAAERLAESVKQAQARLAESHDYHAQLQGSRAATDATRRYGIDARSAVSARSAELRAQGMSETAAHNRAMEDLNAGRLGVQQQNADTSRQNADTGRMRIENTESYRNRVLELRARGLDQAQANQQALQEHRQKAADLKIGSQTDTHNYRMARLDQIDTAAASRKAAFDETVKQHGIANDRAAQAGVQRDLAKMTSDAIRIYTSSRDIMGKFLLTPAQAQQRADDMRARAPAPAAAAAQSVPQVGEIRKGFRFLGGDPGQQTSWAPQ